jgi:hypothetical protein
MTSVRQEEILDDSNEDRWTAVRKGGNQRGQEETSEDKGTAVSTGGQQ